MCTHYTVHTAGVRVYSKWTFNNLFEQVPERYLTLYIYHYTRTMFAYSVIQLVLTSHCPVFQTLRGVTSSQTLRGVTRTYLDDILYINYHCPLFQIIREVVHTTTTWAITPQALSSILDSRRSDEDHYYLGDNIPCIVLYSRFYEE